MTICASRLLGRSCLTKAGHHYRNGTVAFTLKPNRLITSRDNEMPDFRLMRLRVRNARVDAKSPVDVGIVAHESPGCGRPHRAAGQPLARPARHRTSSGGQDERR
jgi:hypothetical protein